jgi:hypothetical protein
MDRASKILAILLIIYALLGIGRLFVVKEKAPVSDIQLEQTAPGVGQ